MRMELILIIKSIDRRGWMMEEHVRVAWQFRTHIKQVCTVFAISVLSQTNSVPTMMRNCLMSQVPETIFFILMFQRTRTIFFTRYNI
jgi:hypothetical protein